MRRTGRREGSLLTAPVWPAAPPRRAVSISKGAITAKYTKVWCGCFPQWFFLIRVSIFFVNNQPRLHCLCQPLPIKLRDDTHHYSARFSHDFASVQLVSGFAMELDRKSTRLNSSHLG